MDGHHPPAMFFQDCFDVCGQVFPAGGVNYAIIWQHTGNILRPFGTATSGSCRALTDDGYSTGYKDNGNGTWSAFLYNSSNNSSQLLTRLSGYQRAIGTAMNGSHWVVGYCNQGPTDRPIQAFLAFGDQILGLGTLKANNTGSSEALGVNDAGVVVGWADADDGLTKACAWINIPGQGYKSFDLNKLAQQSTDLAMQWKLSVAYGVNNLGEIACTGTAPDGGQRAALLSRGIWGAEVSITINDGTNISTTNEYLLAIQNGSVILQRALVVPWPSGTVQFETLNSQTYRIPLDNVVSFTVVQPDLSLPEQNDRFLGPGFNKLIARVNEQDGHGFQRHTLSLTAYSAGLFCYSRFDGNGNEFDFTNVPRANLSEAYAIPRFAGINPSTSATQSTINQLAVATSLDLLGNLPKSIAIPPQVLYALAWDESSAETFNPPHWNQYGLFTYNFTLLVCPHRVVHSKLQTSS